MCPMEEGDEDERLGCGPAAPLGDGQLLPFAGADGHEGGERGRGQQLLHIGMRNGGPRATSMLVRGSCED